ncbi:hypothetical protein [Campylobacter sp. MIT 97-5078]|uniref:hypothetical protein n=1 Tax=Campylobacter sp. MIT 97-5078 TaxID=1548153 RepID=UPI000512C3A4|nr:hypothetical protein [Campylobacter sp. MIT 97-5078]KGI55837.1 hypothetical protein LR59_10195 [Campylobacter sp. MIT 97-5078]KGI56833.1 hypothetical protein LR59_04960 [Campylobacter sp. MIT 97-5078]TQR25611.1 hypothetical protein DMB91_07350 [Campylobacter sp. MIT 97-5078]
MILHILHTLKTFKKLYISFIVASALITDALATGIPVVDVGSISQAVLGYAQQGKQLAEQIKQYQQLIIQVAMQEKLLTEQGVGMDIKQVLGELDGFIDETKNNLNFKVPDELFQETSDMTNACAFLQQNSKRFEEKITQAQGTLKDQINLCISAVNTDALNQDISDLQKQISEFEKEDKRQEALELEHKIIMMNQSATLIKEIGQKSASTKIINMYDEYINGTSKYSKDKDMKDLEKLAKSLQTEKNQKQAQALTNTMLLKLLEQSQRQYEASMQYYSLQSSMAKNEQNNRKRDYTAKNQIKAQKAEDLQSNIDFQDKYGTIIYDNTGFPDYDAMTKQKTNAN